jgi:putative tryptophan/tyrosine transport system substrate-binding protein
VKQFWILDPSTVIRTGFGFWIGRSRNKKEFCLVLCAILFTLWSSAQAQQQKKIPRIGFLGATYPSTNSARIEAFRQGMRELGYIEGENIAIEYRWAEGNSERLPGLASELVRLKVDMIVTAGPAATRPAKQATSTIPIVMSFDNDPVGNGFVSSLAQPGGNVTGLSAVFPELSGKRLELLKEVIPKLSRIVAFGTFDQPGTAQTLKETERAASALGLHLQAPDIRIPSDIETAFQAARRAHADASLVLSSPVLFSRRTQIAELAVKNRLPVIFPQNEFVEDGGLMSYAPNYADLFRRAATYVDKILKGAKPAGLPVEQPTKFEFVINLKTAKQIGLAIPPNVLARADRVIR